MLILPDADHGVRLVGDRTAPWLAVWHAALYGHFEALTEPGEPSAEIVADAPGRHRIEAGRDRRIG